MPRTEFDTDAVGRWSADTQFPVPAERTRIVYAQLGADAGFIGAAACGRRLVRR